jgi:hypothetical protein
MTTTITSPWLTGATQPPAAASAAARWVKGMPSPNPRGRPRGIIDKRTKVTQALMDDAPAVARVVIDAALEGDLQACGIVLARVAPALRPEIHPVQFPFDASAPIAQQIECVLAAMAGGAVSPDVGKQIVDAIKSLAEVRAVEELEARIIMLEAKEVP